MASAALPRLRGSTPALALDLQASTGSRPTGLRQTGTSTASRLGPAAGRAALARAARGWEPDDGVSSAAGRDAVGWGSASPAIPAPDVAVPASGPAAEEHLCRPPRMRARQRRPSHPEAPASHGQVPEPAQGAHLSPASASPLRRPPMPVGAGRRAVRAASSPAAPRAAGRARARRAVGRPAAGDPMADPALLHQFIVEVDSFDLGSSTSCSGLAATYGLETIVEGGLLGPSVQTLKSVTYGDVTVERPVNEQSATVAAWFSAFASSPQPTTAAITALDPRGQTICQWNLDGVVPRSWSGPAGRARGPVRSPRRV